MTESDLTRFRQWFSGYVRSFRLPDPGDQENIALKEEHTRRVCENSVRIAEAEGLGRNRVLLAETIGLFHDVGRFPQYAEYRTFRDSVSVNHGELGAKVLGEKGVLHPLSGKEQGIVSTAVRFHNVFRIPDLDDPERVLFIRLIRDADKLDIWRVFFEYYEEEAGDRPSAVGLGLPDSPGYSPEVLALLFDFRLIPLSMLKSLNDFKLTKLSWMYDLNFTTTYRLVRENGYIDRIAKTLPRTEEIEKAVAFLHAYLDKKIKEGKNG
ncbi:MAG: HD domain-containing protein [Alphaproteobacteria bacterium]|uniref:HD domain-containing protein n=1 Tax=Candidatus Nitrobium versatile TaxID=2884831 RepID=A0A953M3E2_9BACT|nr:HD domain-containing protein [Candidatus Nitrobium versatile]